MRKQHHCMAISAIVCSAATTVTDSYLVAIMYVWYDRSLSPGKILAEEA